MYKFSGHETFPCRYAWLPKAFIAINENPRIFSDEDEAIVKLGVGKNMMRAIRFWVLACDVAERLKNGDFKITDFGIDILGPNGFDPFLEDIRTLWLLHWKLTTHSKELLFAWDYLLNKWQHPELRRSEIVNAFQQEATRIGRKFSPVTLTQHFDVFLHTYVPTRSPKGKIQEDNLDCPLVELELIQQIGEKKLNGSGKREFVYAFRREEKPEITHELFIYFLNEFWNKYHSNEKTVSFREISIGHGSPGQILKLSESNIRERLDTIQEDSNEAFSYQESVSLQRVMRHNERNFLREIYSS